MKKQLEKMTLFDNVNVNKTISYIWNNRTKVICSIERKIELLFCCKLYIYIYMSLFTGYKMRVYFLERWRTCFVMLSGMLKLQDKHK